MSLLPLKQNAKKEVKNMTINVPNTSRSVSPVADKLFEASSLKADELLLKYHTNLGGFSLKTAAELREKYGSNTIAHEKQAPFYIRLAAAFVDPFTLVLCTLAAIMFFTDVIMAAPGHKDPSTAIIICVMVLLSGLLRFVQETRSGNAAEKLKEMVHTTASAARDGDGKLEIPLADIVPGDIIYLSAGDMVPADVRVLACKDLFIGQSSLTGESKAVEKYDGTDDTSGKSPLELRNLAFMGSNVISGTAICLVIATGNYTCFGSMAKTITGKPTATSFDKGVNSVSWVLIRFMLCMVPLVFFVNGFTKGSWLEAFIFALSVAVGLTPEMLPMIVTTNLAKGASAMAKKKTIVKRLNSMQNFGAMDVLCTDKTGTITQDKVMLEYYLDPQGNTSDRVLRHAFVNSFFQTGLKNLMDVAILKHADEEVCRELQEKYHKVDEIPFDFNRRRMSVVVRDTDDKTQMITKGAVEEMLSVCSHTEYDGKVVELDDDIKAKVHASADTLNEQGMRVIAIAHKTNPPVEGVFSVKDESDMVLIGFLAFLDPPKETAAAAIKALFGCGVDVKVLTGDNEAVTCYVCKMVGLKAENVLTGSDIENMDDGVLTAAAEKASIFAKLSPLQKSRIVTVLRRKGHTVGFMGDGINDAAAMHSADVAISVDTAVDIAKESADIILLEKDLMVLKEGVIEGRRTFGNIIKYIKMTASSNFGNMFSVLAASAFLPFLPMQPVQILFLNLIYDFACVSFSWDSMDDDFLRVPRKWDASSITKFMLWLGPTSSVFDIATYLLLYFAICPAVCGGAFAAGSTNAALFTALFNTGWFVESLFTQELVIHMLRTPKIPFLQSTAARPVLIATTIAIAFGTSVQFTPIGRMMDMTPLPAAFFPWLAVIVVSYMALTTIVKKLYVRKYGELL
jgi:Mg2+-importing ATPase